MERAQEQVAKWGLPRSTLPSGYIQPHPLSSASRVLQTTPTPLASTHEVAVCQRPEFHVPVPSVASSVSGEATSSSAKTQTTFSTPAAVMSVGELIPPSHRFPSQFGVTSQVSASSSQPQRVAETSSETQRPVSSIEQATTVTTETPVVVLEQVHEPVLVEQEKFQSVNIPSHLHLSCDILPCPHQRALIKKAITDQSVKLPLSSPVAESDLRGVNIEQTETERGYKPRGSVSRQSHDTRHIHGLPRTKQARSEDGKSKVGPHELKERTTSLPEESEGERQKTKDVLRKKPKFKTKRETFHDSSPSDVLSGVIGQVKTLLSILSNVTNWRGLFIVTLTGYYIQKVTKQHFAGVLLLGRTIIDVATKHNLILILLILKFMFSHPGRDKLQRKHQNCFTPTFKAVAKCSNIVVRRYITVLDSWLNIIFLTLLQHSSNKNVCRSNLGCLGF